MKIYSNVLTGHEIEAMWPWLIDVEAIYRPRVRRRGFRVKTAGNGPRRKNTGTRGASDTRAATWGDHGRLFARIFEADPEAVIVAAVRYIGAADFHYKTVGKFATGS